MLLCRGGAWLWKSLWNSLPETFFLTGIRRLHLVRDFIPLHVAPGSMAYGFLSILHNCSLWSFAHILSSSAPLSSLLEFHGHPGQRSHPQRSFLDPISSCPPSPPFAHTLTSHGRCFVYLPATTPSIHPCPTGGPEP